MKQLLIMTWSPVQQDMYSSAVNLNGLIMAPGEEIQFMFSDSDTFAGDDLRGFIFTYKGPGTTQSIIGEQVTSPISFSKPTLETMTIVPTEIS